MPDTHINAFFADVEEKLQALLTAQNEYEAAKKRLEEKKKQVDWVDEKAEVTEVKEAEPEPTKEEDKPKKSVFGKK